MTRLSWDEAKRQMDGHTSAGRIHPAAAVWTVEEVLGRDEGETQDTYRVRASVVVEGVRYTAETWIIKPATVPAKPGDTFRPWLPGRLMGRANRSKESTDA